MTINQINKTELVRLTTDLHNGWLFTIHDDGLRVWTSKGGDDDWRVDMLFKHLDRRNLVDAMKFIQDFTEVYGKKQKAHNYGYEW